MSKNLVICLDGTGDFAAQHPTHVFRLFRSLARSASQEIYYDGGVGTLRNTAILSAIAKTCFQDLDLATGFSIGQIFCDAYRFLSAHYEEGDRIFLFGFSRGAYTARALAGAIHYFGVPYADQEVIIPYLWQAYAAMDSVSGTEDGQEWARLRRLGIAFGRPARIAFLGLWDTVSSFGLIKLRTLPQTAKLAAVDQVRHAVSIDERRNMFPENLCDPAHPDLKEVWFAGVHRDVGGGGNPGTAPLSMITYRWMEAEWQGLGLQFDSTRMSKMDWVAADPCGKWNYSFWLIAVYALAGLLPMRWWSGTRHRFTWKWLNLWHIRRPGPGALVHESVQARMKCKKLHYSPRNIIKSDVVFVGNRSDGAADGRRPPDN